MPFGLNIKEITAQVNAKFDQLVAELRALGVKLDALLTAIQEKE